MKPGKTALLTGLLAVLAACGTGLEATPPQVGGPAELGPPWSLDPCLGVSGKVGPPGSLDLCFGVVGKVITDPGEVDSYLDSIVVQPDGMIVGVVRDEPSDRVRLVRYYLDGTLDQSFDVEVGRYGCCPVDFGSHPFAIAIQPDGKFLVVGKFHDLSYVYRFNSDGSHDSRFGLNGVVNITASGVLAPDHATALAIQSDGKIVVVGTRVTSTQDFLVIRFNTDGSLDTGFDGDGIFSTSLNPGEDRAQSVAIQSDDKIVVGGYSHNGANYDFALIRLNSDGSLDPTFSGDGKLTTGFGSGSDGAYSIAIQPDGQIVAAGYAYGSVFRNNPDIALVRYNPDGSLDRSFGLRGRVTTAIGTGDESASSLVLQPDGKIVVGGTSYKSTNLSTDFAVVRYNPDGSLDTTFDGDGKLTTDFGGIGVHNNDVGRSLLIQPDGLILLAGHTSGTTIDSALARYNP